MSIESVEDGMQMSGEASDGPDDMGADPVSDRNSGRDSTDNPRDNSRGTPAEALETMKADRDRLAAEGNEWKDRYLRGQAEFQNFRKRVEKERIELLEFASTEAVRSLLPIFDDFERALKTETADREYSKGMELIYQRMYEALKKLGLEPIVSLGQAFDPHVHHAVEMVETEEAPDHTILAEYQRGYNFKGRMLRPAMVKVAVAPAAK